MADTCRSCRAPIIWAVTRAGKRMPVDEAPVADGLLFLIAQEADRPPLAADHRADLYSDVRAATASGAPRFTSHFATCPNAKAHRGGR